MNNFSWFESGFAVVDADELQHLTTLRSNLYSVVASVFPLTATDPTQGFNYFHRCIADMTPGQVNSLRIELIQRVSAQCNAVELIFEAFAQRLLGMLGPDILAQKTCNLVLQPPLDPNPSEIHRDAPANSPYEIVMWVPMVDCFGTKSMYILDVDASRKALDRLEGEPSDWSGFEAYAKALAVRPSVNFGQALIFHTGCLHGSDVNRESETRVSLNIRYKNLFSPSGLKNQLQFFRPLRISTVARLGGLLEARELRR